MASPPTSKWPFHPFWELDGFDFSKLPSLHSGTGMQQALEKPNFTTVLTATDSNQPSQTEDSRRVCNNVAVQFRAMLYCKDAHPGSVFWQRVQQCSHRHGTQVAEDIGAMFVEARKAYLRFQNGCPNEAAKLVDDWISFVDSIHRRSGLTVQAPVRATWDTRYQEWSDMRERGGLMDSGQSPAERSRLAAARQQPARDAGGSTGPTDDVRVKREEGDIPDDASVVDLGSAMPDGFGQGVNGSSKRRGAENPDSRLAKRRVDASTRDSQVSGPAEYFHLRSPPPSSPLAPRRGRQSNPSSVATLSSPVARQMGTIFAVPGINDNPISTASRLTYCEQQLTSHMSRMLDQDLRLTHQKHSVAQHATKIEGLESRLRIVEERSSVGQQGHARGAEDRQGPLGDTVEAIRESVAEHEKALKGRSNYIRKEIRSYWKEQVDTSITQEQTRISARLDGLNSDLAVHKARIRDYQKAVDGNTDKIKKHEDKLGVLESSLKKKSRQGKKIDELSNRLDKLEKSRAGKAANDIESDEDDSSSSDEEDGSSRARLLSRVGGLEERAKAQDDDSAKKQKQQWSAINKLEARLRTIEGKHPCARESLGSLASRVTDQAGKLAKQEKEMELLKKQLAGFQGQLQKLKNGKNQSKKKGGRAKGSE